MREFPHTATLHIRISPTQPLHEDFLFTASKSLPRSMPKNLLSLPPSLVLFSVVAAAAAAGGGEELGTGVEVGDPAEADL